MTDRKESTSAGDGTPARAPLKKKHRQVARLKTRMVARLSIAHRSPMLCEIGDFSPMGLQLICPDRAGAGLTLRAGDTIPAIVEFLLDENGVGQFALHGSLVRVSHPVMGLKLEEMANEAYRALVAARDELLRPTAPPSGLLPEEIQAILRDSVQLFQAGLDRTWQDFAATIARKIETRDTGALALVDQSRFLGALSGLHRRGEEIGRGHYANLIDKLHRIGEREPEPAALPTNSSELSLVDEHSFDDWLNIANVFNRIEADNRAAMFEFEQLFGRILPVRIDRHNDPFGPESVCLTFREALGQLDIDNDMRAVIYELFGAALSTNYPTLLEQLNRLLAPLTPTKPERPAAAPAKAAQDRTAAPAKAATDRAATSPDPVPVPARDAGPNTGDILAQVDKLAEIAEKLSALAPNLPGPTPAAGAETRPAPPADEAAAYEAFKQTLAQLAAGQTSAPELAARPPDTPRTLDVPRSPDAPRTLNVPRPPDAPRSLDALLADTPAGSTLGQRLTALLDQNEVARLSVRQRDSLGVAANLMDQALTKHGERSELDAVLKKLEKPLYELVLQGEDPLNRADHPLARLLNLVDRFAIVTDDQGRFTDRELADLLGAVIDQAIAKADTEPDSYAKAVEALEKLLKFPSQYHKQRVAGHQEGCEAKELIRSARQKVADQLDYHLSGRVIPKIVLSVLEHGLRQHLVIATLRGRTEECWTSQELLSALCDKETRKPPETCHHEIETRMRGAGIDRRQVDACLADLAVWLDQPGSGDGVSLPAGWFRREAGMTPPSDAAPPELPPLRLGDWWDFDQDGRDVPMQLIWLGEPPERLGFVNRAATRNLLLTATELAKRLADGTAHPGEDRDLPLLERSENSAVDNLYQRLAHRAHRDPATHLLNHKGLLHAAAHLPHRGGKGHVLGMLEFIPYRAIHDTCGVEAGERLSRELAKLVQQRLGPNDALAAVGDGRFALLLADMAPVDARKVGDALVEALRGFQFRHDQASYGIEIRVGLAGLIPGVTDAAETLRRAGSACAAAERGDAMVQVFEDSGEQLREQESLRAWGRRIDELLDGDGLFLRCQQVAPLREGATAPPYYEVLLGLRDESGQVVSPQPFVEAVEYWHRSHDLDLWVIERTFAWIRSNPAAFDRTGGFSINLSALSMSDAGILSVLHGHLAQGDIATEKIVFEITETATVGNYDAAREFIRQIRHYGCRFSIDDFGSGNASYGYLRQLRTDSLKIDGAYVKDMASDPDLRAMVKSMNDIGHSLGMKTVAEFIATPELLAMARAMGVDYGQGYEIAKPIHIDELTRL